MTVRREVARSAALTAAALALVGLGGLWAARSAATAEAVHQAEAATSLLARAVVEPALGAGLLAGEPDAIEQVDQAVATSVISDEVVAARIWDGSGRVLYSDDLGGIGQRFPLGPDEQTVLATGRPSAELSDLAKAENAEQLDFDSLLEVYVALDGPSGQRLLFETYQTTAAIDAATRRILGIFAPVALGGLLALGAVQALLSWRLARRLEAAQAEREELLEHALAASEHERRTIAADLHDGVVQDLVGLTYSLDAMAGDPAALAGQGELASAAGTTRSAVRSLRSLLVEIYPANLAEVGLAGAIADLADSCATAGVAVAVQLDPEVVQSEATRAAVYRTVREALSNVRRHSGARHAEVRLSGADGRVTLTVRDDGIGFDPAAVPSDHVGLRLLRDLATALRGRLAVESAPGRGTLVLLEVPA